MPEEARSYDLRNCGWPVSRRRWRPALRRKFCPVPGPSRRQAGHTRRRFDTRQRLNISKELFVITANAIFLAILRLWQYDMEGQHLTTIKTHVLGCETAETLHHQTCAHEEHQRKSNFQITSKVRSRRPLSFALPPRVPSFNVSFTFGRGNAKLAPARRKCR